MDVWLLVVVLGIEGRALDSYVLLLIEPYIPLCDTVFFEECGTFLRCSLTQW